MTEPVVFELLRELLPIEATSGREGAIGRYLTTLLEARGYAVTRNPVPAAQATGTANEERFNVLATFGEPTVLFSTHMDTVPPHLEHSEDEENFYGRGSCDAEGCMAAMIEAGDRLRADELGHGLLFVVGEETTSDGSVVAARDLKNALAATRFVINGEPTDCKWVRGSLGIMAGEIHVEGQAAHSAYPEQGRSAVHELIPVLDRILKLELPHSEEFGTTYLNLGRVEGGVAHNVLAPEAMAQVLARATVPAGEVEAAVVSTLSENMEWRPKSHSDPQRLTLPPGTDDGIVVNFGSDVPRLSEIAPCLMMGPGTIHVAHSTREFVPKSELLQAVDLYEAAARQLISEALS